MSIFNEADHPRTGDGQFTEKSQTEVDVDLKQSRSIELGPTLVESQRKIRGHNFYPPKATRAKIPGLYVTDDVPAGDKTIHLHYFGGNCDWYIAEMDWETGEGFGYADLGLGHGFPEWGYIDLPSIESARFKAVGQIVQGQGAVGFNFAWVFERDVLFEPVLFRDTKHGKRSADGSGYDL